MFEIVPEPEFSTWFESLDPTLAEAVVAALEVVAAAGKVLSPTRLSRALLWFDASAGRSDTVDIWATAAASQTLRECLEWHQHVRRTLEDPAFVARLRAAAPERAAEALRLVEQLKRQLRAATVRAVMTLYVPQDPLHPHSKNVLEASFLRLLELVGLQPEMVSGSDSGLRELTVTTTSPKIRILFGFSPARQRLLAIVGEPLDRSYYGDSVRLAEARWATYIARDAAMLL